jgi:hypothetical protein
MPEERLRGIANGALQVPYGLAVDALGVIWPDLEWGDRKLIFRARARR